MLNWELSVLKTLTNDIQDWTRYRKLGPCVPLTCLLHNDEQTAVSNLNHCSSLNQATNWGSSDGLVEGQVLFEIFPICKIFLRMLASNAEPTFTWSMAFISSSLLPSHCIKCCGKALNWKKSADHSTLTYCLFSVCQHIFCFQGSAWRSDLLHPGPAKVHFSTAILSSP